MWRKWNPNPQGLLVGDCTIRAICAVTGESWDAIHDQVCALSKEMADMPSADRVWWELLRRYGFARSPALCSGCAVKDFARAHQRGTYVLGTKDHAVALIDGDWWDTWDSGSAIPTYYFRRL